MKRFAAAIVLVVGAYAVQPGLAINIKWNYWKSDWRCENPTGSACVSSQMFDADQPPSTFEGRQFAPTWQWDYCGTSLTQMSASITDRSWNNALWGMFRNGQPSQTNPNNYNYGYNNYPYRNGYYDYGYRYPQGKSESKDNLGQEKSKTKDMVPQVKNEGQDKVSQVTDANETDSDTLLQWYARHGTDNNEASFVVSQPQYFRATAPQIAPYKANTSEIFYRR